MPQINWTELRKTVGVESRPNVAPAGVYEVVVTKGIQKKTSTGKDQLSVILSVTEGLEEGKILYDNLVVSPESPAAMRVFIDKFSRYGGSFDSLELGSSVEQAFSNAVGTTGTATAEDHVYDGRTSVRVKRFKAHVGSAPSSNGQAEKKSGVPF